MYELILGGGLSGLIWSYYNHGTVLTKDVGGQQGFGIDLGPRFLHKTKHTEKLLSDLHLDTDSRTIRIGYFYDGKMHNTCTGEMTRRYYEKSRGIKLTNEKAVMTQGKNSFEAFNIPMSEVLDKLKKMTKCSTVLGEVTGIDLFKNLISINDEDIYYDKLVSTIPLPIFYKLAGIKATEKFISNEVMFVLVNKKNQHMFDHYVNDYDYTYFLDDSSPFYRMTKTDNGLVIEYRTAGMIPYDKATALDFGQVIVKLNSQIVSNDCTKNMKLNNVRFLGRFGTWNRDYKVDRVTKEAQEAGS